MNLRPLNGITIPVQYIQKVVSDVAEVPLDDINVSIRMPGIRKREKVLARQISMCFSRIYTRHSLAKIGMEHGGRDHATVLHAWRSVNNLLDTKDHNTVKCFQEVDIMLNKYINDLYPDINEQLNQDKFRRTLNAICKENCVVFSPNEFTTIWSAVKEYNIL